MNWQKWILVALCIMSGAASILTVGQPRKPLTPAVALTSVVIAAAMAALVVTS